MSIDYELLLAKYIEHVGAEEGTTFIQRLYPNDQGVYEGTSRRVGFTAEEVEALRAASAHVWVTP